MATSLMKVQGPQRGPELSTALLHTVHALSLPVRMGVGYVARSQMFFWSCQHSVCALECGVFVWKWLQQVDATSNEAEITGQSAAHPCGQKRLIADPNLATESQIIRWVRSLVIESLESLEPSEIGLVNEDVESLLPAQLGRIVLHLWSRILLGNSLWPLITQIGETFRILASQTVRG